MERKWDKERGQRKEKGNEKGKGKGNFLPERVVNLLAKKN